MDQHTPNTEVDLDAHVEEIDDAVNPALSTAATASSAGTFVGTCFSSAACFSTATS